MTSRRGHWQGFPSRLRVGAHSIKVRVVPASNLGGDGDTVHGEYSSIEQTFRFNAAAPSKSSAADTVVHEICHALLEPLSLDAEDEERVCYVLGGGIVQVLRDNPKLLEFLSDLKDDKNNGSNIAKKRSRK